MISLKNFKIFIILLFPILVSVGVFYFIKKPDIDFLSNSQFIINSFTDNEDGGHSTCTIKSLPTHLSVNYQLKKGYEFPYAGIQIQKLNASLFNVEQYILELDLFSEKDLRVTLRMSQFLPNYSDTSNSITLLYLTKPLVLKKGDNRLLIKTDDINEIPNWWFESNPTQLNKIKNIPLSRARDIMIVSDYSTPLNSNVFFQIIKFKLKYNALPYILWSSIFCIVYYLTWLVIWLLKRPKNKYILLPMESTVVVDGSIVLKEKLESFMQLNYSNPNLKINDLIQHLNISEDKCSSIFKQYFNKNFRQYLNQVRMEEACRLLVESDLQIAEIAYKVGYNNVTHFNRVFKEEIKDSPKNYRERK